MGALCLGLLLAGCSATPTTPGFPEERTPVGSTPPGPSPAPSTPGSVQDVPQLPIDTAAGAAGESLPWTLTRVDTNQNRVYLSAQVPACNEPVQVRYTETSATVEITLVGTTVPPDTVCPLHVTVQTGYVQLPHAIGGRSIKHAPVTPAH